MRVVTRLYPPVVRTALTPHPSLAAELLNIRLGKLMKFISCFKFKFSEKVIGVFASCRYAV